jgi:cytoskeletal protein CcmA (bactofilin family)
MQILKKLGIAVVLLFLCVPVVADARSVVRIEDGVSVAKEAVADGDLYAVAETAAISGLVAGDFITAAGEVTISGRVASDTLALAAAVSISGEVGDDVRVVGDTVTVTGTIEGDLFVVARRLTILSDAAVRGDVLFFGQTGVIEGQIGNDVLGRATDLRLDGAVGGMVDVTVETLTLGDRANVTGDVRYESARELIRAPGAVVSGSVLQSAGEVTPTFAYPADVAIGILMILFAALSWYLVSRRTLEQHAAVGTRSILRSGLIGAALFFVAPFVIVILVMSQLGLLLALLGFALYIVLIVLAMIGMVPIAGELLRRYLWRRGQFGLVWLLAGSLVLGLLLLVPAFAALPALLLLLISVGALTERLYTVIRY